MKNTDEVNALKVIQMYEIKILTKQPAFKIEYVVTNKNFIFLNCYLEEICGQ